MLLNDTDFDRRSDCPFYKNIKDGKAARIQMEKNLAKAEKRAEKKRRAK